MYIQVNKTKLCVKMLYPCDAMAVFFNAHSSKSTSCYDCPIPYDGVYADSHGTFDIATGKFLVINISFMHKYLYKAVRNYGLFPL